MPRSRVRAQPLTWTRCSVQMIFVAIDASLFANCTENGLVRAESAVAITEALGYSTVCRMCMMNPQNFRNSKPPSENHSFRNVGALQCLPKHGGIIFSLRRRDKTWNSATELFLGMRFCEVQRLTLAIN